MYLAKIVGNVVATRKSEALLGKKLMIVRRLSGKNLISNKLDVVVDTVGSGIGDIVLVTHKGNLVFPQNKPSSDSAIVGIVDTMEFQEEDELNQEVDK